ncbi:MAG: 6-phosphofructokinase, partial [Candidatus Eremiobacteraeota bacterium]|nr:6-phosphofructokinase [Candidatus Eremiobacteraeota bacterium]
MTDAVGILVGGGPAPGINGVIASAAMEAFNCGLRAIGIYDGYRDLAAGRVPQTVELTFDHVSRIHTSGGSILRTSRTNPAKDDATLDRCAHSLEKLGIRYLICIGGD